MKWILVSACALMMPCPRALAQGNASPTSTSFRPGHNLTLIATGQQALWKVERAGEVRGLSFRSWEPGVLLRYTFHLNLVRKLGLVLGTGTGGWYQNRTHSSFHPGSSFMFPSIIVGLVQNFEADTRVVLAGEYAAIWYPWLRTRGTPDLTDKNNPRETSIDLGPIPDAFTAFLQLDHFAGRNMAFSAVAGWRVVSSSLFGSPSKTTLIGSSSFRNSGLMAGVGLTWTLGDELGR